MRHVPSNVAVVTALHDGAPEGMTVGSFTSASLDPPLVSFFVGKTSTTWPLIESAGRFCVNVLAGHRPYVAAAFSARDCDRFRERPWTPSPLGSPRRDDLLVWLDCELYAVHESVTTSSSRAWSTEPRRRMTRGPLCSSAASSRPSPECSRLGHPDGSDRRHAARVGQPEDIANTIVFPASDGAGRCRTPTRCRRCSPTVWRHSATRSLAGERRHFSTSVQPPGQRKVQPAEADERASRERQ